MGKKCRPLENINKKRGTKKRRLRYDLPKA
jgi:hypothetical protein